MASRQDAALDGVALELAEEDPRDLRQVLDMVEPGAALADRYASGNIAIHVHLGVWREGLDLEAQKFCTVLESAEGHELLYGNPPRSSNYPGGDSLTGIEEDGERCMDDLVLVDVGEMPQESQVGRFRPIRSVVRLHALNDCPMAGRHALEGDGSLSGEVVGVVDDREGISPPRRLSVGEHELPDQVIERGPDVVNHVSEDHPQPEGRIALDYRVDDVVTAFRVEIGVERATD